jgi:hypothetical protein
MLRSYRNRQVLSIRHGYDPRVSIDKARIEAICAARFPSWFKMSPQTQDKYRRQCVFWTEAVDVADADAATQAEE